MPNEEHPEIQDIDKPKELYHASPDRNIAIFEPRAEGVRDPDEGPVVFGTPYKAYASMFLVNADDRWTSLGRYNNIWVCVIGDVEKYISRDRGGAIYKLNPKHFHSDPHRNMYEIEWVSKEPVTPQSKEEFESGLKAMITLGVKVYVMKLEKFEEFKLLKKNQRHEEAGKILLTLIPETLETISRFREIKDHI